jgi:hypothetical protein
MVSNALITATMYEKVSLGFSQSSTPVNVLSYDYSTKRKSTSH